MKISEKIYYNICWHERNFTPRIELKEIRQRRTTNDSAAQTATYYYHSQFSWHVVVWYFLEFRMSASRSRSRRATVAQNTWVKIRIMPLINSHSVQPKPISILWAEKRTNLIIIDIYFHIFGMVLAAAYEIYWALHFRCATFLSFYVMSDCSTVCAWRPHGNVEISLRDGEVIVVHVSMNYNGWIGIFPSFSVPSILLSFASMQLTAAHHIMHNIDSRQS